MTLENREKRMVEGVLILRNSSLKLKKVADNAILQNYAVSSENISESIKIKTENSFRLKRNVGIFRRNKNRPGKQSHRRHLCCKVNLFQQIPTRVKILFQNKSNFSSSITSETRRSYAFFIKILSAATKDKY